MLVIVVLMILFHEYFSCDLYLALTPNRGRTVFAGKNYEEGDEVDWGPAVSFPNEFESLLSYYVYESEEEDHHMLIMGTASMLFNHRVPSMLDHEWSVEADDIPKVETQRTDSNSVLNVGIRHTAAKTINLGEEIFFDYGGNEWFTDRNFTDFEDTQPYSLSEFDDHKYCISNVYIQESNIEYAGLGLFTNVAIKEGNPVSFAAAAPVLWEDLINIQEDSVLLNYGITSGNDNEEYLLIPLGPITYANHGDHGSANVELRYFDFTQNKIVNIPPKRFSDIVNDVYTPIDIALIALRDIEPGEELLLDYGESWELVFEEYLIALDEPENYVSCSSLYTDEEDNKNNEDDDNNNNNDNDNNNDIKNDKPSQPSYPELNIDNEDEDEDICFADVQSLPQFRMPIVAKHLVDWPDNDDEMIASNINNNNNRPTFDEM